jgi:CBS domain containing-hemolysin-like protein
MGLLLTYLFLALITSFLCSIMEAVLLSTPLSYLRAREAESNQNAIKFIKLKSDIDKPLSAILSLNTVAHTVGAAGVGAQATQIFGEAYFGLVSAILTILILVLTEIIPKTIGARYWRNLSTFAVPMVQIMIFITYPLVVISAWITRAISRGHKEQTISREEISALANIGTEEGIFGEKENKIIQNLIRLKTVRASQIKTPRVVVAVADEEMTLRDFWNKKELLRFSRIPTFQGNDENITGYIFRQSVFEKLAEDDANLDLKIKEIKRDIVFAPKTMPVFNLWDLLLKKKEHIALITDEYGGMDGVVSMEDIIETLLGFEIVDEKDTIADMQDYARQRWNQRQEKYNLLEKPDKHLPE